MTRTGQYGAVIAILIVCLAVTAFGAVGGQAVRSLPAPEADDTAVPPQLEAVEPALAHLVEAAGRYAADADAASRERLERVLARFAETRASVERLPAATTARQRAWLAEAVRALVPRIHVLAIEIADEATPEKLALLGRLADKTRAALDQLRDGAAPRPAAGTERIASLAPGAADSFAPEGVVVLFLTVVGAVGMAFFASTPAPHLLRRMRARESRRGHGWPR